MIINFDKLKETTVQHLNDGEGAVFAKMFMKGNNKIMISRLPVGASIGMHRHEVSSEINYIISGNGKAICDGKEEELISRDCHYCSKESSHSIINTGMNDLVLFTVVYEQ